MNQIKCFGGVDVLQSEEDDTRSVTASSVMVSLRETVCVCNHLNDLFTVFSGMFNNLLKTKTAHNQSVFCVTKIILYLRICILRCTYLSIFESLFLGENMFVPQLIMKSR